MFTIRYSKQAVKTRLKMQDGIAGKIDAELEKIAEDPKGYKGDWKRLEGTSFWRLRVGAWRVICDVLKNELIIYVLKTGSRGDVYK
ncbi:MAG TPA: type II toxin-antitoxin system RelE/ParE family toxin [Smithellaceae bacterium]|nr:type II toxin-antitoxin system RelE/ParE family toxin [Smithellaceae bacterium]